MPSCNERKEKRLPSLRARECNEPKDLTPLGMLDCLMRLTNMYSFGVFFLSLLVNIFLVKRKQKEKKMQTNVNVTHTEYWFLCFFAFPFFVERRIRTPCFTDSKSRLCFTWKVSALPNWKYTQQRRASEVKKRRRRRSFFSFLLYSVLCKTRKMSCLRAEWNNS